MSAYIERFNVETEWFRGQMGKLKEKLGSADKTLAKIDVDTLTHDALEYWTDFLAILRFSERDDFGQPEWINGLNRKEKVLFDKIVKDDTGTPDAPFMNWLRNLLAPISGYLDLIKHAPNKGSEEKLLATIKTLSERLDV
ncbi:MAG: hypothetical protein WCT40_00080 [Candidatus Magasanikbacteria bacterium]|jgi:hypothetical protein